MDDALGAIGRNVSRLRRARGLSQEELAHAAELRQAYLSQLEAGKRNPTIRTLIRIAEALGVPLSGLIDEPKA